MPSVWLCSSTRNRKRFEARSKQQVEVVVICATYDSKSVPVEELAQTLGSVSLDNTLTSVERRKVIQVLRTKGKKEAIKHGSFKLLKAWRD